MNKHVIRRVAIGIGIASIAVAVLLRIALSPIGLGLALRTQGLTLGGDALDIGFGRTTGKHIVVRTAEGKPFFSADRLIANYDLKSLVTGGPHAFGLVALDLERPAVTLERRADGSWNLPLAGGKHDAAESGAAPRLPAHLRFTARIDDGSIEVRQPELLDRAARTLLIEHLALAADVDSDGQTAYRLRAEVEHAPLVAQGGIDAVHGVAVHRARADRLPIAAAVNAAVNSAGFVVQSGRLEGLELDAYGKGKPGEAVLGDRLFARAKVRQFGARIGGLEQPLQDIDGNLVVTSDTLSFDHAHGLLAGMPLTAEGSLYAFARPQLRISAAGSGDLQQLRSLFGFAKALPVRGPIDVRAAVEGSVTSPLVSVALRNGRLRYNEMPVALDDGLIRYYDNGVDLSPVNLRYGAIALSAGGVIATGDHVRPELVLHAQAPGSALPYLDGIYGGPTDALVLLGGQDTALEGRAVIDGSDGTHALRGVAHLDGRGEGLLGPIVLTENGRRRLLAGGTLVRPQDAFVGIVQANHAPFKASTATLPGLALPMLPPLAGSLDGGLALAGDYRSYTTNANVSAEGVSYNGRYAIDRADAAFSGDIRLLDIESAELAGPFGRIRAHGRAGTAGAAITAQADGDLGVVGRIFGIHDLAGRFTLPVDVQSDGSRVAVQVRDAGFVGANAFGVPLESLSGRALIAGRRVAVLATAGIAGGEILAGGDLDRGIGISSSGLRLPKPVPAAQLDAGVIVHTVADRPQVRGVALLQHAVVQNIDMSVATGFHADQEQVSLQDGVLSLPSALAFVTGNIGALNGGGKLDLHGDVVHASIKELASRLAPASTAYFPRGTVTAQLQLRGSFANPELGGRISVPEGSVSGLAFENAHTQVDASMNRVRLRYGQVLVGTTRVRLGGAYDGRGYRSYVNAPAANLADFNNLFDQNNMLAGRGRIRVNAAVGVDKARTLADIDLKNVRVSSFELGTTQARWHSQGREITGSIGVDGFSGKLAVIGGLQLAEKHGTGNVLTGSKLDLKGSASDLDLERWLPALGIAAPVTGRLDIAGRASGSLPKVSADLSIDARGATVGAIPVDEAKAHILAQNGRGRLDRTSVKIRGATVDAGGSFGFAPADPIAIAMHAQTPNVGELAANIVQSLRSERADRLGMNDAGTRAEKTLAMLQPLDGAVSTSFEIKGSTSKPRFSGALDVEQAHIRGLSLPRVLASFGIEGKKLNLTDAEIAFEKGNVQIAGSLPLVLSPFSIGPADAPLSFTGTANEIDLRSFNALLPPKSDLKGIIDGAIALAGTPASPKLYGELTLNGGSFVSPVESVPVRQATSTLRLEGRSAKLLASATVGGGVFSLNGNANFENLTQLGHHTGYNLRATSKSASVDLANYGRGTVDADVTVSHVDNERPRVSGRIALSDAQIPFSALYNPSSAPASPTNSLLARTALDLELVAGKNTRIRSGSIDIAATGQAVLGGTIGHPSLDGAFNSTSGSITYFNRSFRLASGRVAFDAEDGIKPQIKAEATTTASLPASSGSAGGSGRVAITLRVSGTPDQLTIGFTSEPSYDRQQILGLLLNAPLLGAVNLNQSQGDRNNGLTIANSPSQQQQISVSQEAFNLANAQLTQSLLAPISNALGGAVGLSDLAVNFDQTGNLDLAARRHIFGNVYAFFRDSLGTPTRQSIGLDFSPTDATAVSFSLYQQQGLSNIGRVSGTSVLTPQQGFVDNTKGANGGATVSGVSFSFNRRFP